jgi:flagellar hook-associated protein 1 FlgK
VATLTGSAVATLPANGSSLSLRLDGQDYTLRMQSGAVVVDGPEAGRIAASFGPDNRLRLSAVDGVTDGAALALPTGSATALAAFGFGASATPQSTLTGRPQTAADLPAGGVMLRVSLGGVSHDISVQAAGGQITATVPAGFAGQVSVDPATGALQLTAPASAGALKIEAPGGAGMAAMGATVAVTDGALVLRATDGAPLQMTAGATSLATQRISMADLPPEDMIVVMSGAGALRLAGSMVAGSAPTAAPSLTLRMADATSGAVEMLDSKTGQSIGTRYLDASGSAEIGGYAVSIKGKAITGDSFTLAANSNGMGDARNADRLHALQSRDPATGKGGFADMLASIQSGTGSRVSAATTRQSTAAASEDALNRALAEVSAVDLDAEAAKLIQLQQGYQASAQMLSIAKSLFDTLLQTM